MKPVRPHVAGHAVDFGPGVDRRLVVGAAGRRAGGDAVVIEGDAVPHARLVAQTPLDRYYRRGLLAPASADGNWRRWVAGNDLRADFFRAGRAPRIVAKLDGFGGRSVEDGAGGRDDAEKRYQRAVRRLAGLADIAVHVCCLDESADTWRLDDGDRAGRGGIIVLRLALSMLVEFYHLTPRCQLR